MAVTQAQIDALEAELSNVYQSIKDGDQLLWYKRIEELKAAHAYLTNLKNQQDAQAADAKGGGRYSLASWS